MMSEERVTGKKSVSSYRDLEEKRANKPTRVTKNNDEKILDDLVEDFGDVLGDGFHGLDDDYYYDEDDV